ncbi:MAG: endolytic transglycosylase MltG, partial [Nitrospiria bacterium]
SIIEKETAVSSERAIVSAVFHNRLKKKMRLQSDPTVIFALTDFDGNLTRKHLAISSPYNTYQVKGLPPGPISNPGRESIHAALYPADVDYLYFVSKNNGTHHFSKTIREHNDAVRKYQLERKSEVMCRSCTQKAG